jgi:hypothetical protein
MEVGLRTAAPLPANQETFHMKSAAVSMEQCIADCEHCHSVCFGMAMTHCLESGGPHVEPGHFRLMTICAELCRLTADAMLARFELHAELCRPCARICQECADSCRELDGMDKCVEACERCSRSCSAMSAG